jgi:hypothetical protein
MCYPEEQQAAMVAAMDAEKRAAAVLGSADEWMLVALMRKK